MNLIFLIAFVLFFTFLNFSFMWMTLNELKNMNGLLNQIEIIFKSLGNILLNHDQGQDQNKEPIQFQVFHNKNNSED